MRTQHRNRTALWSLLAGLMATGVFVWGEQPLRAGEKAVSASENSSGEADTESAGAQSVMDWMSQASVCYGKKGGFTASFVHERLSKLGAKSQTLKGHISVSADGLLAMHYESPEQSQVVFDGKKIRAYDPEKKMVVEQLPQSDALFSSLLQLIGPNATLLAERFQVRMLSETGPDSPFAVLSLTPNESNPLTKQIVVTVGDCPLLRRIIVVDRAGNMIRLTFSEIQVVSQLPKSTFRFRVPKNVTVVRP